MFKCSYSVTEVIIRICAVIVPFGSSYFNSTEHMKSFLVGTILQIDSGAVQIAVLASGLLITLIKAREVVIGKRAVAVAAGVGI